MSTKQIKANATKRMYYLVFEQFYSPKDIVVECDDGVWMRQLNQWVGGFSWGSWVKI